MRETAPTPPYETLGYRRAPLDAPAPPADAAEDPPPTPGARDAVAWITLARPDQMNAMSREMRLELPLALRRAAEEARAAVLIGAPRPPGAPQAFCAGQDLGDVRESDLERTLTEEYAPMLTALWDAPIPVVAALNGAAAGAGLHLALAADVVLAAESATLAAPFAKIGLIPAGGGSWLLSRLVGPGQAKALTMLGRRLSAEEAARMGLVAETAPDEAFLERAAEIAAGLASGPTAAFALTKQAVHAALSAPFETHLATEARLQGEAARTRDFMEGVAAFLEKRRPRFEGR